MNIKVTCQLRKVLKQKGISQLSLATNAGLRASTISDLCNKDIDRIYMSTLVKICAVLNVDIGDILVMEVDKTA